MNTDVVSLQLEKLLACFMPSHLAVDNFSHQHARGQHSHYRVVLVSKAFIGVTRVARHQQVYKAAAVLMPKPVHALMLELFTPEEWQTKNAPLNDPPPCYKHK